MSQTAPGPRIELEFEKFSSFVEDYAENLSLSGMFLRTRDLRPVGSIVDFEIKLVDGFRLVEGQGEVAWVLSRALGPDRPAGMAVRFHSLDDKGRELILKVLEEQVKRGEESFDVEAVPETGVAEAREEATEEVPPDPGAPATAVEAKILDEDGFTLLDADGVSRRQSEVSGETFEQLEFDAPWGEQLPEIPEEILDGELALPEVLPPTFAEGGAGGEDTDDGFDDETFLLAREAADEVGSVPAAESASGFEVDGFDFGATPDEADAHDFEPDLAGTVVGTDDGFLPPADEGPSVAPKPEPPVDAPPVDTAPVAAAPVDTAPVAAAPAVSDAVLGASDSQSSASHSAVPAVKAAALPAPAAPREPPSTPMPAAAAVIGADPPAVQGYEDDLFAEDPETGSGQVLREALGRSPRTLALAAALMAVAGAAWFFRGPLAELTGLGAPAELAAGMPAESAGPPPSVEPSTAARSAPVELPAAASGEDVVAAETPPPVIEVSPEPSPEPGATATAGGTEPAVVAAAGPAVEPPAAGVATGGAPATRVDRMSWRRSEGGTLLTIELDGQLTDDRFVHARLAYSPVREMIRIVGIAEPYGSGRLEVGSPEVSQIRVGHHLKPAADELHVVLDYPRAGPHVAEVRSLGDRLEVLVLP